MPNKTTPASKELGRKIREARTVAGLSVRALARLLAAGDEKRYDTFRRYLIRWESGRNRPDEAHRNLIADTLGVPRSSFSPDAVDASPYDTLLRSLRAVVDHELRERIDPLQETIEELQRVDLAESLGDALAYVYGRVLIAIDLWKEGERRQSITHLRKAEDRLATAITHAREGMAA